MLCMLPIVVIKSFCHLGKGACHTIDNFLIFFKTLMSAQHFRPVHLMPHVPIRLAHIRVFVIQVSLELEPPVQVCVLSVFLSVCLHGRITQ